MQNSPTATEAIARVVSAALSNAGIVQREAAARTGIPLATLSRRLTGNSPFNVRELDLIAQVLGTDVVSLISMTEAAA